MQEKIYKCDRCGASIPHWSRDVHRFTTVVDKDYSGHTPEDVYKHMDLCCECALAWMRELLHGELPK